jgi:hypothetical protein
MRPSTPTASPTLFHVEKDFIVVEIGIEGYSGNLRCLQRIDRFPRIGPPDCLIETAALADVARLRRSNT